MVFRSPVLTALHSTTLPEHLRHLPVLPVPEAHEINAVVYHGNSCVDGFESMTLARQLLGDRAVYIPYNYGSPLPDLTGKNVGVLDVDVSAAPDLFPTLLRSARKLIALDHHKTSTVFAGHPNFIHDTTRSGAHLSSLLFHPDAEISDLIRYVEDFDTGRVELPRSPHHSAFMHSLPLDFEAYDAASKLSLEERLARGEGSYRMQRQLMQHISQFAVPAKYEGLDILVINSPVLGSELGFELAPQVPSGFVVIWFYNPKNKSFKYSLRGTNDGPVDVSKIAAKHSGGNHRGGGHKGAAGFSSPLPPWEIFEGFGNVNPA